MTIHQRLSGDVTILDIEGEITTEQRGEMLREAIRGLLDREHKRILLNLELVRFIDSSGLGDLIALKKAALVGGADLKLLRPQKKVYSVLAETSLSKVFECFDDEGAAIASFGARVRSSRSDGTEAN